MRSKTKKPSIINSVSSEIKTSSKTKKWISVTPLVIIVLVGLLYYFKGQFVVAMVNGKPITRLVLIQELEKQAGKKTLESLVTKTLILQEAKKQKVVITDDEVNQEIKKLEENFKNQGQDFNQLLEVQGITKNELMEEIRLQKIVEKIVGKDISVTDEEVNDYLEKNKDLIPKDTKPEEIKEDVKEQIKQQKMNEKIQSWLESLRKEAKINYF